MCVIVRSQAAVDRDVIELAGARFVQTGLDAPRAPPIGSGDLRLTQEQ
jgi:hypothetical protein